MEQKMNPGDRVILKSIHHAMNPTLKALLNVEGTILYEPDMYGKVCVIFDQEKAGWLRSWWINPSRLELIQKK